MSNLKLADELQLFLNFFKNTAVNGKNAIDRAKKNPTNVIFITSMDMFGDIDTTTVNYRDAYDMLEEIKQFEETVRLPSNAKIIKPLREVGNQKKYIELAMKIPFGNSLPVNFRSVYEFLTPSNELFRLMTGTNLQMTIAQLNNLIIQIEIITGRILGIKQG